MRRCSTLPAVGRPPEGLAFLPGRIAIADPRRASGRLFAGRPEKPGPGGGEGVVIWRLGMGDWRLVIGGSERDRTGWEARESRMDGASCLLGTVGFHGTDGKGKESQRHELRGTSSHPGPVLSYPDLIRPRRD